MTKKFNLVVLLLAFFGVYTHVDAQSESFKSPVITDEMRWNGRVIVQIA